MFNDLVDFRGPNEHQSEANMIHNEPQGTILDTKNGPEDAQERLKDQHSNLVHQKGLKNTKFDDEAVPN